MKKAEEIENKKQSSQSNNNDFWVLFGYPFSGNGKLSKNKLMEHIQLLRLKNLTKMEIYLKK